MWLFGAKGENQLVFILSHFYFIAENKVNRCMFNFLLALKAE